MEPLGVELPLNVMKIDVLYWKTDHSDICTADDVHHTDHSMGVFINCEDEEDIHFYGLPAYEYPGLVKVSTYIHMYVYTYLHMYFKYCLDMQNLNTNSHIRMCYGIT